MRLFIAIQLSEPMKAALTRSQRAMYDGGVRGRFAPEENLHLTLAFIGEYPETAPVMEAFSGLSFSPFELRLEGLGCFGDLWWAGVGASGALDTLARRVRHALAEHGIPFDRKRFSPHITLLRSARGAMPGVQPDSAAMTVEAISLMRSDRGKSGMIYTEVGRLEARV